MPATSLTKVTSAKFADGIEDVNLQAVDQPNGNDFVNTGKTVLVVNNGSGGTVQPSFAVGPNKYTMNDSITVTPPSTVAAGDTALYGPFPTAAFGSTVTVNWDTGTSITAAPVELEDTPL